VHRDPCDEAAALMLELTRSSESSDTGLLVGFGKHPYNVLPAGVSELSQAAMA
jgi:hypothetical protein